MPMLLALLALTVIRSDNNVSADSNLRDTSPGNGRSDEMIERFGSRDGHHHNTQHRPSLLDKLKRPKSGYSAPKSQYKPPKSHRPSKAHSKPKGKYGPPKAQTYAPVKNYEAPAYNPPAYSPPAYSPPAYSPPAYSPPKAEYGPPKKEYGPPKKEYGPPKKENDPPKAEYNPPNEEYKVPIEPAYIPKVNPLSPPVANKDSSGFFSSPSDGFPNFFKQIAQG